MDRHGIVTKKIKPTSIYQYSRIGSCFSMCFLHVFFGGGCHRCVFYGPPDRQASSHALMLALHVTTWVMAPKAKGGHRLLWKNIAQCFFKCDTWQKRMFWIIFSQHLHFFILFIFFILFNYIHIFSYFWLKKPLPIQTPGNETWQLENQHKCRF